MGEKTKAITVGVKFWNLNQDYIFNLTPAIFYVCLKIKIKSCLCEFFLILHVDTLVTKKKSEKNKKKEIMYLS